MHAKEILEEKTEVVEGTNCANCKFTKGSKSTSVEKEELNAQGGLKITNAGDLKKAKEADLVTLPGKGKMPTVKVWCKHKDVDQWVTPRMCCAFWDAPGVLRDFGEKEVGK